MILFFECFGEINSTHIYITACSNKSIDKIANRVNCVDKVVIC